MENTGRPRFYDHDKVIELRHMGLTAKEIAKRVGFSERLVRYVCSKHGILVGQKTSVVDVDRLSELWKAGVPMDQIGEQLGCTASTVRKYAWKHGLPSRGLPRQSREPKPPPGEDAASAESLAFSPWVAARIRELKLGMPA